VTRHALTRVKSSLQAGQPAIGVSIRIRIEDDALVTAMGCELTTRGVPVKASEVESLMAGCRSFVIDVFPCPLKSGMKIIIRTFFKTLRIILGPVMLLKEKLTRPKGIIRPQAAQQSADLQCQSLALYQYKTCPFCMKVRQEIGRLSLNIKRVDAQPSGADRDALTREGGQTKVPCLKITDTAGNSQWLYDSEKIVGYLRGRFAAG
jgi:glutaredoxin